jgi:hypothetical protein
VRQLRQQHRERPSVLPQLRGQALNLLSPILAALIAALLLICPSAALAAEVLSVQGSTQLQVGDHNRIYGVRLACVQVNPPQEVAALDLVRQRLPRHSRINLRPVGASDGELLAQVKILPGGDDLGLSLVAAGLAAPLGGAQRPSACPGGSPVQ